MGFMNLRRLQYFLAVVDHGTVTGAADKLHMAQPALSRQIKTLERELKLELFEPQGSRLALTAAGRALVPAARRLVVEALDFESAATLLRTGKVERLTVAATSASLRTFLAPFIATMTPADPQLVARETSHFEMTESLRQGCDFAVSPQAPDGDLRHVPLGRMPVRAYVSKDHEWARDGVRQLPLSAFAGVPAILTSHHSVSRFLLDDALSRHDVTFSSVTECDDGQSIMALAVAGHGVGFSTERPLYGAHPILVLDDDDSGARPLGLALHVAWLPGHYAEAVIEELALRIRDFLQAEGIALGA
ncbi:DNA-binding transcriptional regulator, LysR family [Arthrobacter cupressi]|uniref:DNA-binding transcriptional regulator, LysR family n=2 Tax=Arthrobacter cupressi TaxID=1045773 RepID=A0A1G8V844_9MICC|nr:DNA-binding transcriptional regulator, LysR family [Arthrobacter cupressi]